jgi:hypothetical protein
LLPATVTITLSVCSVVMLYEPGVTVTAGRALFTVTASEFPVALLYKVELFVSGV